MESRATDETSIPPPSRLQDHCGKGLKGCKSMRLNEEWSEQCLLDIAGLLLSSIYSSFIFLFKIRPVDIVAWKEADKLPPLADNGF